MTTLIKVLISCIISLLLFSCNFDINLGPGVKGNNHVVSKNRDLNGNFNEIKISRGLDVYLAQNDTQSLTVEADENLHDLIITKIENGVLEIYADENISYAASKKVMLNFKNVSKITATSGSDVYSNNTIKAENLELTATSGSDMSLDSVTETLSCNTSSGSNMKLSGKTEKLYAQASSGSDMDAANLSATTSEAKASSGADITVNTSKELYAKTSSGGDITYFGNPKKVNTSNGVSGSIHKQ
ncbi:MAG: head GIN domain-containing protein [Gelidibacter sp.]